MYATVGLEANAVCLEACIIGKRLYDVLVGVNPAGSTVEWQHCDVTTLKLWDFMCRVTDASRLVLYAYMGATQLQQLTPTLLHLVMLGARLVTFDVHLPIPSHDKRFIITKKYGDMLQSYARDPEIAADTPAPPPATEGAVKGKGKGFGSTGYAKKAPTGKNTSSSESLAVPDDPAAPKAKTRVVRRTAASATRKLPSVKVSTTTATAVTAVPTPPLKSSPSSATQGKTRSNFMFSPVNSPAASMDKGPSVPVAVVRSPKALPFSRAASKMTTGSSGTDASPASSVEAAGIDIGNEELE